MAEALPFRSTAGRPRPSGRRAERLPPGAAALFILGSSAALWLLVVAGVRALL